MIEELRSGSKDINNHDPFFSKLIKGLLLRLNSSVRCMGKPLPHVIYNTGDDTFWLELKGYKYSESIQDNSNEQYIYGITPRCIVEPGMITINRDQMSSPYARGTFEYESGDALYTLSAEVLRVPITMNFILHYQTDTFTEALSLIQQTCTKLSTRQEFSFVYMGQIIQAEYMLSTEYGLDIYKDMDGTTLDDKSRKMDVNIDVATYIPVFDEATIVDASKVITNPTLNMRVNGVSTQHITAR